MSRVLQNVETLGLETFFSQRPYPTLEEYQLRPVLVFLKFIKIQLPTD